MTIDCCVSPFFLRFYLAKYRQFVLFQRRRYSFRVLNDFFSQFLSAYNIRLAYVYFHCGRFHQEIDQNAAKDVVVLE